jgi:hypothetical protein
MYLAGFGLAYGAGSLYALGVFLLFILVEYDIFRIHLIFLLFYAFLHFSTVTITLLGPPTAPCSSM